MRTIILWSLVLAWSGSAVAAESHCPRGDFKACTAALKQAHTKDQGKEFIMVFDDICGASSKFKCTKVMVMSNIDEVRKEKLAEKPKAVIFQAQQDDGQYLYIFEARGKN